MLFAHDTVESLTFAAELLALRLDAMPRDRARVALTDLIDSVPFTGRITRDDQELTEVLQLCEQLAALWDADRDNVARLVNETLRSAEAVPQLVRHDDLDWHIHAVAADRPLAERIAVEVAVALLDLVRTDDTARLKQCDADGCDARFLDESRNRSRRFCSAACQNRTNVAAYRARKAAADD